MTIMNYHTLRTNCPTWDSYIGHDFVTQLAAGTLAYESFRHYLIQDYLYLIQYTRVMALSVYKSDTLTQMRMGQVGINAMLDIEITTHLNFCRQWGLALDDVAQTPKSAATTAYSDFLLATALSGSLADLYAAIAPCLMGYGEIGKRMQAAGFVTDNPYQSWIDVLACEDFQAIIAQNETNINQLLAQATPAQADNYQRLFNIASGMEINFWQMALDLS